MLMNQNDHSIKVIYSIWALLYRLHIIGCVGADESCCIYNPLAPFES